MIRPLLFGIAILIAGATQATAQGLPSFKIVQGCREVSSGQNKLTTFDECMEDEKSARDDLAVGLRGAVDIDFPAVRKRRRILTL